MKTGNKRVVQVNLSDLPKSKMYKAGNNKSYISLTIWDLTEMNHRDQDCTVQVTRSPQDIENDEPVIYVGGGLIHEVNN